MPWQIERITCSGAQCRRDIRTLPSQSEAENLVFKELPWRGEGYLRHIGDEHDKSPQDCVERDLFEEHHLEFIQDGVHTTYRLSEI